MFVYSDKEELPHNIQELLSRHNFSLVKEVNGLFINKKLRFIETTFVPGELLGVLGIDMNLFINRYYYLCNYLIYLCFFSSIRTC